MKPRLWVERLEDILAPAHLTWGDYTGDGLASDPNNWYNTDAGRIATAAPQQGDDLTFDGSVFVPGGNPNVPYSSNAPSCTGLAGFGNAMAPEGTNPDDLSAYADFDSISLVNSYSGTVTLAPYIDEANGVQVDQVSVMTLTVESGTIAQQAVAAPGNQSQVRSQATSPPPAVTSTDLVVYGAVAWTGGTIGNSVSGSTTAANLWLEGGGAITPANAGTVTLGDTMNVDARYGATTLTQNPGTIQFVNANAGGMNIQPNATEVVNLSTAGTATYAGNAAVTNLRIAVAPKGTFTLTATGGNAINNWVKSELPVANLGGTVSVSGPMTAIFVGGSTPTGKPVVYDYTQTAGALQLQSGASVQATTGVDVQGGQLLVKNNAQLNQANQVATITGNLIFEGGSIQFDPPFLPQGSNTYVYAGFLVTGNVTWSGGTYMPGVDYSTFTGTIADLWTIGGTLTLTLNNTDAIQDVPQNVKAGTTPPKGTLYGILGPKAVTNNNNNKLPGVNKDTQGNTWALMVNNGNGSWSLQVN